MRKYGKDGRLDCVICNRCGKNLAVKHGIVREGVFTSDHRWDFFSEKDGEIHHFDLCEDCYDEMTAEFRIPVDVEDVFIDVEAHRIQLNGKARVNRVTAEQILKDILEGTTKPSVVRK